MKIETAIKISPGAAGREGGGRRMLREGSPCFCLSATFDLKKKKSILSKKLEHVFVLQGSVEVRLAGGCWKSVRARLNDVVFKD